MTDDQKNLVFADEKALLLDHNYDGIEEFNHPLPMWWLLTFYGAILFAAAYCGYYLTGVGPSLAEIYQKELTEMAQSNQQVPRDGQTDQVSAVFLALKDTKLINEGKAVYDATCVACHGPVGEGSIGPNLTDRFWLHGAKVEQLLKVVNEGVPEKGMPPWGQILKPEQVIGAVAYIYKLQGSNPVNGKAPQGQEESLEPYE